MEDDSDIRDYGSFDHYFKNKKSTFLGSFHFTYYHMDILNYCAFVSSFTHNYIILHLLTSFLSFCPSYSEEPPTLPPTTATHHSPHLLV